ncbi:hypothetical protein [Paraburkholderia nemoris]|uniref:hypothetical protein n=1 Tax=Paraburkholderia nemoris TaxID=2793076 RepID=UPI0038BAD87C
MNWPTRWTPRGEAGWQGKVQGEPHNFVLPAGENFEFGFVWTGLKTTVIAPRALP